MKRLFKLGLVALMGVCGLVGISRAEDPETPTTLPTPTFTPNSGTVAPGATITFTIPEGYENAQVFVFYTINDESNVTLETTYEELMDDFDNDFANMPFKVAAAVQGQWMYPCVIPSNASGQVSFQARMAAMPGGGISEYAEGDDEEDPAPGFIYSEVVTATYTVEGEVVTTPVPAPRLSIESGSVAFGTTLNIEYDGESTNMTDYTLYYVLDDTDFDFSQYEDGDAAEAAGAKTIYGSYKLVKNTTIKVALLKSEFDMSTHDYIYTWSETVTGTYTVGNPEAPTFTPAAGTVESGAKVTIKSSHNPSLGAAVVNIYYTTDDNTPTTASTKYTAPIEITEATTIKAIAVGVADPTLISEVAEAAYTIGTPDPTPEPPAAPAVNLASGGYVAGTEITISKGDADSIFVAMGRTAQQVTADGIEYKKYLTDVTITLTADTGFKAYAMKDGLRSTNETIRNYQIKAAPVEPTPGVFTFTPEPSETALDAGTKLALGYTGTFEDIYYKWFADEATAKATGFDEGGEWAWYVAANPEFAPVLTVGTSVLKVVAIDEDANVLADSVVVYTVKTPSLPVADFTFTPASGSTVAPDAKITVTAEIAEGQEIDYKWFNTKEEADAAQWGMDWMVYDDEQPVATLQRGLEIDTLYLKVVLVTVDLETMEGTVAGYGQASYVVDGNLVDKITVTPNGEELVRENDSVTIAVEFAGEALEGTLVYKWYASVDAVNADAFVYSAEGEGVQTYNAARKPVITRENPVLVAGFKNAEGWVIEPVTIEYIFDPAVTEFTIAAAGKNEMKEDTVVFDGVATFKMTTDGDAIKGLKIAAKIYSKDYKDTITTNGYEATDTIAEFVGIYNGEYVVNFSLRHAYAAGKDSVIADTVIYFNVTNYEEVVENYELTVEAVGAGENNTFSTAEVAFDMFVKGMTEADDDMMLYTTIFTKAQFADTVKVLPNKKEKAADSVRFETTLEDGEYVGLFELRRPMGRDTSVVEDFVLNFTVKKGDVPSAIESAELAGVNVYPNPNAGSFNVAVPERARVEIFGLNGAMLMSREVNAGVEAFSIDHSGIYFVRVMAGNKTAVKRVIVR